MTELLRAYENMYSIGEEYCVLCLRSGSERRMMPIKNLELFIKSINLPFNYFYNYQRVCWICERAAVAAYRLRLAVNLSSSIHGLFALMEHSAVRREDVTHQLRGLKEPSGVVQQAFEWDTRLKELRARCTLLPTEVLVVASVPPNRIADLAAPPDESDVYLIPDEVPQPPRNDHLSEPEIYLESVILEDDEHDPIAIKQELAPHEYAAPGGMPPASTAPPAIVPLDKLVQDAPNSSSFLLHPIMERNGVISVPTLNAQIINGQLMSVDKFNFTIQTPRLAVENDFGFNLVMEPPQVTSLFKSMDNSDAIANNIPLHILESNSRNSNTVTQPNVVQSNTVLLPLRTVPLQSNAVPLQSNTVQLQSNAIQQQKSNSSTLMAQNSQNNVSTGNSQEMQTFMRGKPFSNNNIVTHSIIIDDDDEETDTEIETSNVRSKQGGKRLSDTDSRRKRERDKQGDGPPKKQKETDWEDKIPMDVISYMDATDPNADSVLRDPTLGIISAVQSVTEEAHSGFSSANARLNIANSGTSSANSGTISANSGTSSANSGTSGVNSGTSGVNSGTSGVNSGTSGVNSGTSGVNSGTSGVNSGTSGVNSGTSSVNSETSSAQIGSNNAFLGINSVRSRQKNLRSEMISVDSIIDSVRSRKKNLRPGTISVDSIMNSVRSGLNSALPESSSTQIEMLLQDSSNVTQDAGGGRSRVGVNVHQNVFVSRNQGKLSGEVIDLC